MKLLTNEIKNRYVRENFERVNKFLPENNILTSRFKHFSVTFTAAVTNFNFTHNLGFQPKDVILTSITGVGSVTFNYGSFTTKYINLTTTGACVIRFFAGTYVDEAIQ